MTMRSAIERLLLCFAVLAVPASGEVQAQQSSAPPNALQGFSQNRDQPVRIRAEALEVRNQKKVATYTGSVHLVQGDTTLRCKTLIVYYDGDQAGVQAAKSAGPAPAGGGNIRLMEAIGQVVVSQKDQTATGEKAVYDMAKNLVTLSGPAGSSVVVTQGPNVARGPRLVVHLDTGISHFEGGVETVFVPSSNKPAPASDPKAAPRQAEAAASAGPKPRR
jgi:lipopolysaccharide export system protein LptA